MLLANPASRASFACPTGTPPKRNKVLIMLIRLVRERPDLAISPSTQSLVNSIKYSGIIPAVANSTPLLETHQKSDTLLKYSLLKPYDILGKIHGRIPE